MADNKKIVGFKKFSDIKSGSSKVEEVDMSLTPDTDLPMNPNTPTQSTKIERPASRKNLMPKEQQDPKLDNDWYDDKEEEAKEDEKISEDKVQTYGRVAKFPKNVQASKAFNFLENVKVSKKSIWYIMVEKLDNELQMVKYNHKEGVDLNKFVNELKTYYITKYKDPKMKKLIESIYVDGNDKYSMVKNIPLVEVEGKKLITKITEDLIKLLSK
jgi:hypothetical protein